MSNNISSIKYEHSPLTDGWAIKMENNCEIIYYLENIRASDVEWIKRYAEGTKIWIEVFLRLQPYYVQIIIEFWEATNTAFIRYTP